MNRFAIARARTFADASALLKDPKYTLPVIKAGGMDVVDHLKEGLMAPDLLVDVLHAKRAGATARIRKEPRGPFTVEAVTTLAELAASDDVNGMAPVVAQAAGSAATPHVRNVATIAGNLLQRPRCWYYRNAAFDCLKKGGHTCYAVEGENRYHAVFGDGPCHIVHPSNLAVALSVVDCMVHVTGGDRDAVPVTALYHMPDRGIRDEHRLQPGEVVTHVTFAEWPRSAFYAVKEKQSFDWPTVMVAAALRMEGYRIAQARICAGAVAPIPWMLGKVAQALVDLRVDDDAAVRAACALASDGAKPLSDNGYKVKLLPVAVRRAVMLAAGQEIEAS